MPHTLAALAHGHLSEWRATLLARETACLAREHRELIDAQLCADPTGLRGWGDRRLIGEISKIAYRKPKPPGYGGSTPPRTPAG
jgi:hypothetical protein